MKKILLALVVLITPLCLYAQVPTYSTEGSEIWYYIQFVSNNLVIQSQGAEKMLTIETPVENQDAQLWKVEKSGDHTSGDLVTISNKADPTVKLRFISSGPDGGSGFYGTTTAGSYGEPSLMPTVCTVSDKTYPSLKGNPGSTLGYLLNPDGDTPGSKIKRNPNGTESGLPENALNFLLPDGVFTGIQTPSASAVKVYPNPTSEKLFVELPENATNITVLNITGQTVKRVKLSSVSTGEINISDLAAGIYFLKIEKPSGVETTKFLVKK
ncbi:MAG: T9SS type A sorting domain-containing protein [Candidatus Symbiothrix sp.]|jgi:hypothetical protein|nr:T9SS type A sorting domain-containing protein [Candidatus Symbiothrix sp.]